MKGTIFTVRALAADGQGRLDHPNRIERWHHGALAFTAYSAKAAVRNPARTRREDLKGTGIR